MLAIDQLTQDLDWRESELGSLKIILNRPENTRRQTEVLLRAAWAMLYAHYEGYSKFCLTLFYDEAKKKIAECKLLPETTRAFALDKKFKEIRTLPRIEFLKAVETFEVTNLNQVPDFPKVDTESNLWPDLLIRLLEDADIQSAMIIKNELKLKTLVSRRNGIAHGEKNMISEITYYISYELAVYEVMYDMAYLIDERLASPPYN